jgi:hypothetical protein
MKVGYDFQWNRERTEEKVARNPQNLFKVFIALDDRVGFVHLQSRNGKREEFQMTLSHPHEFRKTFIWVFRLKGLRWSLLRKYE